MPIVLPNANKPIGVAVVKMPSGQEIRAEVYIDKAWVQKLEELVRAVNALET